MNVHRIKPSKASPTFEKMNQERIEECAKTIRSVQETLDTSKRLTQQSDELVKQVRRKRREKNNPHLFPG